MKCSNCGNLNEPNTKFCIKCGQNLQTELQNNTNNVAQNIATPEMPPQNVANPVQNMATPGIQQQNVVNPVQNIVTPEMPQQNVVNPVQNMTTPEIAQQNTVNMAQNASSIQTQVQNGSNANKVKISFGGYFYIILAVIIKPFTALKEELNKFNSFKNSAILALIISIIATIINAIKTMFNTVRVTDYSWFSTETKTTWVWENLKDLNYFELIGKNLLIYLGIILAIAGVYYIAGLIIKKQTNFSRLLGISALSIVPIITCMLVLSPLLSLIYAPLGMGITLIGAIYTIILVYEGINNEILIEGNAKYYFNLICLSILGIAAYYLYTKLFVSSISSGLNDILNMFG